MAGNKSTGPNYWVAEWECHRHAGRAIRQHVKDRLFEDFATTIGLG